MCVFHPAAIDIFHSRILDWNLGMVLLLKGPTRVICLPFWVTDQLQLSTNEIRGGKGASQIDEPMKRRQMSTSYMNLLKAWLAPNISKLHYFGVVSRWGILDVASRLSGTWTLPGVSNVRVLNICMKPGSLERIPISCSQTGFLNHLKFYQRWLICKPRWLVYLSL